MRQALTRLVACCTLAVFAAGCSGGGTPSAPVSVPAQPASAPSQTTATTVALGAGATTFALPAAGGIGGSVDLAAPVSGANGTLRVTASTNAPAGAASPQDAIRHTQATGSLTVLYYATFTPSIDVTFSSLPGFTIALPASVPTAGRSFYYALSDPTVTSALQFRTEGPAKVAGRTLTFGASAVPFKLVANETYVFAFYAVVANVAQQVRHVLLISVDGMHQVDLARYVAKNPSSNLASLAKSGISYTNAHTPTPSDSFPGLMGLITGGHPATTGVYYDDAYDRALRAPGSTCSAAPGTEVQYAENIDKNPNALDGGGASDATSIDPAKLPIDCSSGVPVPLYPHAYLRVNTIFEVAKAAGSRTAWTDKHPAYDIVNGPSGSGVDDLFTPEIAAGGTTGSILATENYDDVKVASVINEIRGLDHTGTKHPGVPAIFGMNFQAVSVGQKLPGNGYTDAAGTPSAGLQNALDYIDASLGRMLATLDAQNLRGTTLVVVTAKHGQAPIDPARTNLIVDSTIPNLLSASNAPAAQATQDDIALLWLANASTQTAALGALKASLAGANPAAIASVFDGQVAPPPGFGRAPSATLAGDSRAPDVVVRPQPGVIYVGNPAKKSKIAEHGGLSDDDTHVALLLSYPGATGTTVSSNVGTVQVAPTIVSALGLDPGALQAVAKEGTPVLPSATFVH